MSALPLSGIKILDLTRVLKQEGRGSTASAEQARTRRALVVGEVALSLVLMIAAALLLRSFWSLAHAPLAFDATNVTTVHTRLPYPNDPNEDLYATAADEAPFVREVLRRLKELPGVQEAAFTSSSAVPLDHREQNQWVLRVLFEHRAAEQPAFVNGSMVTPEYFHLLRIPLLSGRLLTDADDEHAALVAVVNKAMAEQFWPNESPIGKRIKLSPRAPAWTTIVGVLADARTEALERTSVPVIYASVYQRSTKHVAVFLRGPVAANIEDQVREIVQSLNPALPVFGGASLGEIVRASLDARRFAMQMLAAFALTAVLLAGLGIYGVISYMVSERTHEIGVRLALGAQRADVARMVLRQGAGLALAGAGVGLIGALAVTRAMLGILYGVSPADPLTFVAVTALLIGIAFAACYVPARRAVRVDPITALRY